MTRDEALKLLKERGDETPYEDIEKFCEFVVISKKQFFRICKRFMNKNIWFKQDNKWTINNFIIPDWSWM